MKSMKLRDSHIALSGIISAALCALALSLPTSADAKRAEVEELVKSENPSLSAKDQACSAEEESALAGSLVFPGFCSPNGACDDPDLRDSFFWDGTMDTIYIRMFWHILRDDAGNNANTSPANLVFDMAELNSDYAPYGIQFTWTWEYIDNTKFLNSTTFLLDDTIAMTHNAGPEYLDIYVATGATGNYGIFPFSIRTFSRRQRIFMNPTNSIFPAAPTRTLAHEVGHTLGLWHPFRGAVSGTGVQRPCGNGCSENMTTGSTDFNGDKCSDTPPQWSSLGGCIFPPRSDTVCGTSLPWLNIPNQNYMGYATSCRSEFSPQQIGRMHCWIRDRRNDWIVDQPPCDDSTYVASNSNDVDGPVYQWIEADVLGAKIPQFNFYNKFGLPANDDGTTGPHPIGFSFPFYDSAFANIYIGVNGLISFTDEELNSQGFFLPGSARVFPFKTTVAPFFNDHFFNSGAAPDAGLYLYHNPALDTFVIQWQNTSNFVNSALSSFQIVLTSDGNILYQYKSVQTSGLAAAAAIGLLEFGCNFERYYDIGATSAGPVTDSLAVLFKLNVGCCALAGDFNHDGAFNIADVTSGISRIFAAGAAPACQDEANLNGDNTFNIADVTFGIARIFAGGPAPVCGMSGL